MRALRVLLIVDGIALAATSAISDPILSDVASAPALLIGVIISIACLSADLVPPRRRVDVACSALSILAPFPFLLLLPRPPGPVVAGAPLVALQFPPLLQAEDRDRPTPRRRAPFVASSRPWS